MVRSERTGKVVLGREGSSESASPSYVCSPTGMKSCDGPILCAPPQHSGSKESTRHPLPTMACARERSKLEGERGDPIGRAASRSAHAHARSVHMGTRAPRTLSKSHVPSSPKEYATHARFLGKSVSQ